MILDDLGPTIRQRREDNPETSYVAGLFRAGEDRILKKVGEEASEVIIAAKGQDREALVHEMADLWFHCMVLLEQSGVSHCEVLEELEKRHKPNRGKNG